MSIKNIPKEVFLNILSFIPNIIDICKNIYSTCRKFKLYVKYYVKVIERKIIANRYIKLSYANNTEKLIKNIIKGGCCHGILSVSLCKFCRYGPIIKCRICKNNLSNICFSCNESFCERCLTLYKVKGCLSCDKKFCRKCSNTNDDIVKKVNRTINSDIICIDCFQSFKFNQCKKCWRIVYKLDPIKYSCPVCNINFCDDCKDMLLKCKLCDIIVCFYCNITKKIMIDGRCRNC